MVIVVVVVLGRKMFRLRAILKANSRKICLSLVRLPRIYNSILKFPSLVFVSPLGYFIHDASCCPMVSHFEHTPFCRRLCLAIVREDDVIHKTGST